MNRERKTCAGKPDGSPCSAPAVKGSDYCRHHQEGTLLDLAASELRRCEQKWLQAHRAAVDAPSHELAAAEAMAYKAWRAAQRRLKKTAKQEVVEGLFREAREVRPKQTEPTGRPVEGLFRGRDWEQVPLVNQFIQATAPTGYDPVSVNVSDLAVWFLRRLAELPPEHHTEWFWRSEKDGAIGWGNEELWYTYIRFLSKLQELTLAALTAAADSTPVPSSVMEQLHQLYQQLHLSVKAKRPDADEAPLEDFVLTSTQTETIPPLAGTLLLQLWAALLRPQSVSRCTVCDSPFVTNYARQNHCSQRCSNRMWERQNRTVSARSHQVAGDLVGEGHERRSGGKRQAENRERQQEGSPHSGAELSTVTKIY